MLTIQDASGPKITSSKDPPKAKQNTRGPAISASCIMEKSVDFRGFNTAKVWKRKKDGFPECYAQMSRMVCTAIHYL